MQVYNGETITEVDVQGYGLRVIDAAFLFEDEDMATYLRSLQHHIRLVLYYKSRIENAKTEVDKGEYQDLGKGEMDWLMEQQDEGKGLDRFEPFLKYVAPTRPWLLRWP
jgi:hypothetical protein